MTVIFGAFLISWFIRHFITHFNKNLINGFLTAVFCFTFCGIIPWERLISLETRIAIYDECKGFNDQDSGDFGGIIFCHIRSIE